MKKICYSLVFMLAVMFSSCDVIEPIDADLVNVWKAKSTTLITVDGTTVYDYPVEYFSIMLNDTDPDDDGTVETCNYDVFLKFNGSTQRFFEYFDVTDGGNDTATLVAMDLVDSFFYYSSDDESYTVSGNTLTTVDQWSDVRTFTFSINGSTLTTSIVDDNDTPDDPTDDTTHVNVYTLASDSDVANAIDGDL